MKAIELFAGVGGFRLGLERTGHQVIWANEWDKYAADTYDYNFKNERIDRRSIVDVPAGDVPAHDLIVGGFPCQAFSVAGKRRGFDETRGTLFFDILRIAKHHRTPYLLLENVKGLLNHDGGRTFETIMRALDECGYDAQWQVLNSKNHGVPQNRERVIIVANLRGQPRPEVFPINGAGEQDTETSGDAGGRAEAFIKTRHLSQNGSLISKSTTLQASEIPHIISSGHLRLQDRYYDSDGIGPALQASDGGSLQPKIIGTIDHGKWKDTQNALTIDKSYYKGHDNHGQRPMILGGTQAHQTPRTDGLSPTLNSAMGMGGGQTPLIIDKTIRRLTPIECERLQAFPDNWTRFGRRPDGTEYPMSDTQRYKQMGNAVTTNVIAAVASRL